MLFIKFLKFLLVFFLIVSFSGFVFCQDKKVSDSLVKNADLRKQMESVKLEDLSNKLKKAKKLDRENLALLKQKIDCQIYIRLQNEKIDRYNTKDVQDAMAKHSMLESFLMSLTNDTIPGNERTLKLRDYLKENMISIDLIRKGLMVKTMEKRVLMLEKIVKDTEKKLLEAETWKDEDIFVPSLDLPLSFEERIDAMIKNNDPNFVKTKTPDSPTLKSATSDLSKDNEMVADLLKLFRESK